ncbi:MAG: UDP-glucose 4-epimerase GalE [Verrucomicrobiae bacterium]|nr:UDP-glucose 4-epimerase GalE [Verrucomicrobiae bacterium]
MKVFVTGGAGYIGSICVEELLNAGHSVTVFDNLSEGHRSAVDPRAVFVEGDLADREAAREALGRSGAEAVMHFAANALVGESVENPGKYFRNNLANGLNLLEAMRDLGVTRIVFSSTCATYGNPERIPMTEDHPQKPLNPYGLSKQMFEQMLRWFESAHGIRHVILRYFNAAGCTERFGEHHRIETHLIPNVLKVALGQKPHVEVFGTDYDTPDGTAIRDYIHIVDLAHAHILALKREESGIYNLGNGEGNSVRQVIHAAAKITGRKIPTLDRPRRPGDASRLIAASHRAIRDLGWTPRFARIDQILASAWEWHRRHPEGYPD